jgi:hypothetical protein
LDVHVGRLTFGSLFKILFAPSAFCFLILGGAASVAALMGLDAVTWNGAHVHGVSGLVTGLSVTLALLVIWSGLGALFGAVILKLFGRLIPIGIIRIKTE